MHEKSQFQDSRNLHHYHKNNPVNLYWSWTVQCSVLEFKGIRTGKSLKMHWKSCLSRWGNKLKSLPVWVSHSGLAPITTLPTGPTSEYFNTPQPVFGWCYSLLSQKPHLLHFNSSHFGCSTRDTWPVNTVITWRGSPYINISHVLLSLGQANSSYAERSHKILQLNPALQNYNISSLHTSIQVNSQFEKICSGK